MARRQSLPKSVFHLLDRLPRCIEARHEIRHVAQRSEMDPKRRSTGGCAEPARTLVVRGTCDGAKHVLGGVRGVTYVGTLISGRGSHGNGRDPHLRRYARP